MENLKPGTITLYLSTPDIKATWDALKAKRVTSMQEISEIGTRKRLAAAAAVSALGLMRSSAAGAKEAATNASAASGTFPSSGPE